MEKFKVVSWKDCHGVETFFRVVDEYGHECGRFASEWEAQAKATELNRRKKSVA